MCIVFIISSFIQGSLIEFAIFLLQEDIETHEYIPLIIAGGGGGKSLIQGNDAIRADGGLSPQGDGTSALTYPQGPGESVNEGLFSLTSLPSGCSLTSQFTPVDQGLGH